jgi:hypothetical protein
MSSLSNIPPSTTSWIKALKNDKDEIFRAARRPHRGRCDERGSANPPIHRQSAVLTDQAGRAGTLESYPKEHENQPHHAGTAFIWGPDGEVLANAQQERVQEEMILADLDPMRLAGERSLANYMLRTRRPELFAELVRDQVSS